MRLSCANGPLIRTSLTAAVSRLVDSQRSCRPSFGLRSSTALRTARKARRASPCSLCRCRSRPAIGVWSPGPVRPGAEPRRNPAARQPPAPPPRPRRRGRCLTASRGGRCPPKDPPTARGHPRLTRPTDHHRFLPQSGPTPLRVGTTIDGVAGRARRGVFAFAERRHLSL